MRLKHIILSLVFAALPIGSAAAEKRVALVIGNSAYQNATPLANPKNDATAMAATFKSAGFDYVDLRTDVTRTDARRALRDFGDQARDADIAVVYYAGHGIEVDGVNYLIPVDALLERDNDVFDETYSLDRVLVELEPAKRLRLVILDACRDNPFSKKMKRGTATRALTRGLAKVEPTNPNTLIAFAAKAGSTAIDGDGKNSPFATALVNHIAKPGLDLRKAFGFVRDEVLKVTNNKQEPFVYGSLGGNDVSLVAAAAVQAAPTASGPQPIDSTAAIRRDYELALQVGTKEAWDYFIASYPEGFYSNLARAQTRKIAAEAERAAKPDDKASGAVALLSPPAQAGPTPTDIFRQMQIELRRVGCSTGAIDGNWNASSQKSMDLFNKHAGTRLDVKLASLDSLDALKSKPSRVCPLVCQHGFRAEGDACSKIVCRAGFEVGDDNTCERIPPRRPPVARERREPSPRAADARPSSSGQLVCPGGICRPVRRGCRLAPDTSVNSAIQNGGTIEVCN